jgi:hydroxypyruvate reductase
LAVESALEQPALRAWRNADLVIATGKAAAAMARGAGDAARGFVLLPHGMPAVGLAPALRVLRSSHPLPSPDGVAAAEAIVRAARALGPGQRLLYLISGGTSALFEAPCDGVQLRSLVDVYAALLGSGASIHEMNVVRRALSKVKGGGLARAAPAAAVLTLAVSDVEGDDPATIGSGPTVLVEEDHSAARRVLERYGLWSGAGEDVKRAIEARAETAAAVPAVNRFEVVCSAARSVGAALDRLRARGYAPAPPPADRLRGDAGAAAQAVASRITQQLAAVRTQWGFALAGETTVCLPPGAGRGGRNQHVAARIALALAGRDGFACVVAGTDGIDGNSDCAGAIVDGGSAARAARAGVDLAGAVAHFDSASGLEAAGDVLKTGPTGTNVGDLLVAVGGRDGG